FEPRGEVADAAPEIAIGVELLGEPEVGAFDVARVAVAVDAEDLVMGCAGQARLECEDLALELDREVEGCVDRARIRLGRRVLLARAGRGGLFRVALD